MRSTAADGDYPELMFMVSEGGHKKHIPKLLALTHPETEAFSRMALHVAYNLVQYTVDQSTEEGWMMVSEAFLQQIVRCVKCLNCDRVM